MSFNELFRRLNKVELKEVIKVGDLDFGSEYYESTGIENFFVDYIKRFPSSGTFKAIWAAVKFLEDRGYGVGPMQRDAPRGFADIEKYGYISKWRNMEDEEKNFLSGVILPDPEFREGGAVVVFFKDPEEQIIK